MRDCDCVPGHRCDCWDYRVADGQEGHKQRWYESTEHFVRTNEQLHAALAATPAAEPALNVERLAATLRLIHGDIVPLPNRASPAEYARVIADWYGSSDIEAALSEPRAAAPEADDAP
jgi:hypothetical protein